MRIIKMGDSNPQQMTCGSCGCIFEYINIDIQIDHGIFGTDSYVDCPCCKNRIYIYRTKYIPNPGDNPSWPSYNNPITYYEN